MRHILAISLFVLISTSSLQSRASAEIGVVFSQDEIRIISAWYRDNGAASRKGKGKNNSTGLPPGIAKNLARGKPLPPGIARQGLPDELRHALPAPPSGYERVVVDGKVLLVEIATRVIHDILVDSVLR